MSTRQKGRAARSGARDSKTKMTSRASKNSTRRIATISQTAHGADFHGMVAAANASDAGQERSRRIKTRFACRHAAILLHFWTLDLLALDQKSAHLQVCENLANLTSLRLSPKS